MENQKTSSKSVMLNYGIILGFAGIILNLGLYAFGNVYKPHWLFAILGIGVTIAIIVLGIKKFKTQNSGFLKLGEALKIGLGIALISGIIGVIYMLIFANFIEPEHYKNIVEAQMNAALEINPDMSEDQIEASQKMLNMTSGPAIGSAIAIIGSLFMGFIISLIGGLIMKKSDEEITSI